MHFNLQNPNENSVFVCRRRKTPSNPEKNEYNNKSYDNEGKHGKSERTGSEGLGQKITSLIQKIFGIERKTQKMKHKKV